MDDAEFTKIRGSISAYQRLISSYVWTDMKRELQIWYDNAAKGYDNAENMEEVCKIQGRREACEYMMQLPELILEGLLADAEADEASVKNSPKGE